MTLGAQSVFGQSKKVVPKNNPNTTTQIVKGLSNEALNDLLNTCAINCKNGNDVLNSFALYKLALQWGATNKDAAKRFLDAKYNDWMLDKIFILFYGDNEWMKVNFLELGVKPANCKILADFLTSKIDAIKQRDNLYENR